MSAQQTDLFAASPGGGAPPNEEFVAMTRARLAATLELVKRSAAMPWAELVTVIREDNAFRFGKDLLPPEEGARLWAEFDRERDRRYAVMNEGKEMPGE